MADQQLSCAFCDEPFTWTHGEQIHYGRLGFPPPRRCHVCRRERHVVAETHGARMVGAFVEFDRKHGRRKSVTGTIARLMSERGFGFVDADAGGRYFFHASALPGVPFESLYEGQRVEFEATEGVKGPRAENVVLIG